MRGRGRGPLALLALAVSLVVLGRGAGGRELSNVTLAQALGVDGPGPVTLTAAGEEEDRAMWERADGPDLARAREELGRRGTTRLELTHVAQLILGPETPVGETLWRELTNRDSGCTSTVWLSQGPAGDLLTGAEEPCRRLRTLEEDGPVRAPTLLEAARTLAETGRVTLPVLALTGAELRVVGVRTVEEG